MQEPVPKEHSLIPVRSAGRRLLLAVLMIAVVFMLTNVRLQQVIETLAAVNLELVLGAAVRLILLDRYFMAYKWRTLLPVLNVKLSTWDAFRLYMTSSFASLAVPVSLSSEMLRTVMASGLDRAAIASSIIVERFLGFIAVLLVVLFFAPFTWIRYPVLREELLLISSAMLLASSVVAAAMLAKRRKVGVTWSIARPQRGVVDRVVAFATRIANAVRTYRSHPGLLMAYVGLSIIETLMGVLTVWLLGMAIGIEADFTAYLCVAPLVFVLIRLPIFYQGMGAIEAGYAYFFYHAVDAPMVDALSFGLLIDIVGLGVTLLGGLFFLTAWIRQG